MKNKFINSLLKYNTQTENGALSHSTTGSELLDYFSKCGTFRERKLEKVFADMSRIWADSPRTALQIIFYNRLISRRAKGFVESEKVLAGQGNKSEFRSALIWLARYQPAALYRHLFLVPVIGSWKDLWHVELVDELDQAKVYQLIARGLDDPYNRDLLAKYLPRIRSKSNTHNERHLALNRFAHGLIRSLNWTPASYRKFKASGNAHDFQRQICQHQLANIHFPSIPGKALYNWVNVEGKDGKTIMQRHGIEADYVDWIDQQPTAKFTGFVYELMKGTGPKMSLAQKLTIDKQFAGLIELAKSDKGGIRENVWCALDTSGSMECQVADTTAFDICISLGIYFSSLNEGAFKDQVIMFDNVSKVKALKGSFSDKVQQITVGEVAWGSTNFQSVIDEIVRVKVQNPDIPNEDFPSTLIVVSDMQFNPVGGNTKTNYEAAMEKLAAVGLEPIRIVWWWVTGRASDFPNQFDDKGVMLLGGFDGAILNTLLSGEAPVKAEKSKKASMTPMQAMYKALDQEILRMIDV